LNASVNPNGTTTGVEFWYGTTPSLGSYAYYGLIGAGTANVAVSQSVTGLSCGTQYYFTA
jgi:hypothetical protein